MTSTCYTLWNIPTVRVTALNSCGVPVTGCSTVVTDGIISIEMTMEYEDRQEFFVKNGDGRFCVRRTDKPILKWINIVGTFCNVDPELVNLMTGDPLYMDDAAEPTAIGYSTDEDTTATANFALEAWSRIASDVPGTGGEEWGYTLLPWVIEGTVGDVTLENGAANFVVNARTNSGTGWGLGPYFVDYSDNPAGSTTPVRLLTPMLTSQHRRMFITRLAPPDAACGCQDLDSLTPS
jgi:hypothetical protein